MRIGETADLRRRLAAHVALGLAPGLTPAARLLGHVLIEAADPSGRCELGLSFLIRVHGMSRASAFRALAELCRAGLFWRVRRGGGPGRPAVFEPNRPHLDAIAADHACDLAGAGRTRQRGGR